MVSHGRIASLRAVGGAGAEAGPGGTGGGGMNELGAGQGSGGDERTGGGAMEQVWGGRGEELLGRGRSDVCHDVPSAENPHRSDCMKLLHS